MIVACLILMQEDDNRIWTVGPNKDRLWRVVLDALCTGTAVSPSQ